MSKQMQIVLVIIILLGIIIIGTTTSCSNFRPFSNGSFAKFEGFEANDDVTKHSPSDVVPNVDKSKLEEEEDKVEAFQGLQPSSVNSVSTILDNIGNKTNGSINCLSSSAGLTNEKGPLCLSEEQLRLLKTRGGNSAGGSLNVEGYVH